MTDQESKPSIIKKEPQDPPKIIGVSLPEEGVRIWIPQVREPGREDAAVFVARYREFAGFLPDYGFMTSDIERMARMAEIAPVRFIFETRVKTKEGSVGHWMLYLGREQDALRVYDPSMGVRSLVLQPNTHQFTDVMFNDPRRQAQWGPSTTEQRGKVTIVNSNLLNPRSEAEYRMNEDLLSKLGALQTNPYDCGPLCVYAAAVARRPAVIE